jgi:uncharacterized protein (DUF302 family)
VDFAYKRESPLDFTETMVAVERAARSAGFHVRHSYDIRAALAAKGFPIRPLVIFEVAPSEGELDDAVALLMPCRIHVYEEGEEVVVAALRPTLFREVFPEHDLDAIAQSVEAEIIEVVDAATTDQAGAEEASAAGSAT